MCGLIASAGTCGFLLSSTIGAALTTWLSPGSVDSYGWRVPFLLGSLVAVTAFLLRGRIDPGNDRSGYLDVEHARPDVIGDVSFCFRTVLGCACYMFGFYFIFVYLPGGMHVHAGIGMGRALSLTSAALLLLAGVCPLAGMLSDRYGPIPVLLASALALTIIAVPIFRILAESTSTSISIASVVLLTLAFAPMHAITPLPFIEDALRYGRGRSFSIGLNVAGVGFGGLAPIAANLVATRYQGIDACGWLLAMAAIVSATAIAIDRRH